MMALWSSSGEAKRNPYSCWISWEWGGFVPLSYRAEKITTYIYQNTSSFLGISFVYTTVKLWRWKPRERECPIFLPTVGECSHLIDNSEKGNEFVHQDESSRGQHSMRSWHGWQEPSKSWSYFSEEHSSLIRRNVEKSNIWLWILGDCWFIRECLLLVKHRLLLLGSLSRVSLRGLRSIIVVVVVCARNKTIGWLNDCKSVYHPINDLIDTECDVQWQPV